jgi:hypothetical protein
VPDWPVALEIQDPLGTPIVTRTLQTDINGTYTFTFTSAPTAMLGTYTAYAGASYKGDTATANATFQLTLMRDVAVISLIPSKTVVSQGYPLIINVTIANQGEVAETFNVTLYADTTAIETRKVTLPGGTATTITMTWGTTGFVKGNYTLSAVADTVPYEADQTDNTLVNGSALVTLPGDVDGDRDVDIFDIVSMAGKYGTIIPPTWPLQPQDIDGDLDVDIFDVVLAAIHYGTDW